MDKSGSLELIQGSLCSVVTIANNTLILLRESILYIHTETHRNRESYESIDILHCFIEGKTFPCSELFTCIQWNILLQYIPLSKHDFVHNSARIIFKTYTCI